MQCTAAGSREVGGGDAAGAGDCAGKTAEPGCCLVGPNQGRDVAKRCY